MGGTVQEPLLVTGMIDQAPDCVPGEDAQQQLGGRVLDDPDEQGESPMLVFPRRRCGEEIL